MRQNNHYDVYSPFPSWHIKKCIWCKETSYEIYLEDSNHTLSVNALEKIKETAVRNYSIILIVCDATVWSEFMSDDNTYGMIVSGRVLLLIFNKYTWSVLLGINNSVLRILFHILNSFYSSTSVRNGDISEFFLQWLIIVNFIVYTAFLIDNRLTTPVSNIGHRTTSYITPRQLYFFVVLWRIQWYGLKSCNLILYILIPIKGL